MFDIMQVLVPFVQSSRSGIARRMRSRMYRTGAYIGDLERLHRHPVGRVYTANPASYAGSLPDEFDTLQRVEFL